MDQATPDEVAEAPAPAKRPPRVFSPTFSGPGLLMAGLFFALSVQPSLLPRAGYVQGIASGVTLMIGYGLGAGGQALWNYLQIPKLKGRARTIVRWVLIAPHLLERPVLGLATGGLAERDPHAVRHGDRDVDGVAGDHRRRRRGVRPAAHRLAIAPPALPHRVRLAGPALPRRLAIVLGAGGLLLLFWLLITGVLVNGFFAVANVMFSSRDGATSPGIEQPHVRPASGSPESLVAWDELGRQGRSFVATRADRRAARRVQRRRRDGAHPRLRRAEVR